MSLFVDPRFQAPRVWSNRELKKIAPMFNGSVVNVSGWRDADKEGGTYRENYFSSAAEYWITNWRSEARGLQGDLKNELFLDLEEDLPDELRGRFDVVFNHTTLEHIFDVFKAFGNLCAMSKDVVIIVVPFMQEQHGAYGDYWRFTPWAIKRLFSEFGLKPAYINFNDGRRDAIYILGIGVRSDLSFERLNGIDGNLVSEVESIFVGTKILADQIWPLNIWRRIIRSIFK